MLSVTANDWRAIFPRAPIDVILAFERSDALGRAGVTMNRTRLAYFCANVEHECGGFTIPALTENINYTAARMAAVWPSRFRSAADVQRKFGTARGWQKNAFDEIYGGRMGNRPGTHDGSTFIGRGGPQVTGRDGYQNVGRIAGIDLVGHPEAAGVFGSQPEICAAFWTWKGLNSFADRMDFLGCVKAWNGGTNGLADRRAMMAGNDPIIARLAAARDATDAVNAVAGSIAPANSPITNDVQALQKALNDLGANPSIEQDGIYGSMTRKAVRAFQTTHGLHPDGIAGPLTVGAIDRALIAAKP